MSIHRIANLRFPNCVEEAHNTVGSQQGHLHWWPVAQPGCKCPRDRRLGQLGQSMSGTAKHQDISGSVFSRGQLCNVQLEIDSPFQFWWPFIHGGARLSPNRDSS
jgi:hypothetical protein